MTISEQIVRAKTDYDDVWDAGKQAERERFWDTYQDYGNRTSYAYAFAGDGWVSTELLPPKYPMILGKGSTNNLGIFKHFNTTSEKRYDMTGICRLLDCSQASVLTEMFADSRVENITLDLSNCTTATSMFHCGTRGGNIDKVYLKVTSKLVSAASMFNYCRNLGTLRFTEDSEIVTSISLNLSPLTKESIISVINALSAEVTGKTLTLKKTAVQAAFGTDYDSSTEWTTLKNSKSNWTIALS